MQSAMQSSMQSETTSEISASTMMMPENSWSRWHKKGEKADVVIMDPPRTGSNEEFLSSVVKLSPERVVYVSCGPETLARDLKYLTKHGYTVKRATPYDCFPFTSHIETVCCLTFQGR